MSYSSNIITAPVGMYDVQRAISVQSTDLGTLCKHANVNMWAKWKPIKCPYVMLMTSAVMNSTPGTYRYGIKRNGAGVVPLFDPSTGEMNHDVWQYDKPKGGTGAPFRLADFGCWDNHANPGYYHLAPCPVKMVFPDPAEINVPYSTTGNKIGFVFTFENGIIGWRTDGTCLSIQDIFGNDTSYWLTLGLYRNNGQRQYYISSDKKLSDMSAQNPVALVLLDIDDFKSKITDLADGQEFTAIMFLTVSPQRDGQGGGVTNLSGNIAMLEYELNADRKVMTIVRSGWSEGFSMTLTTFLTKQGSNPEYRIIKNGGYGLSLNVTRQNTASALSLDVSLRLICVGGTVGSHGSEVQFSTGQIISFAAGQANAQLQIASLTGYNFLFNPNATIRRAIVNVILTSPNMSGSISIGTDTDCSSGSSTYETTNHGSY